METNKLVLKASVLHKVFGTGQVSNFGEGYITINFPNYGGKKFVYPDAFVNFLEFSDDKLIEMVSEELKVKNAEIEAKKEVLKQKYAEIIEKTPKKKPTRVKKTK